MPGVNILVIDDDVSSQWALRHVLDSDGWKVTVTPLVREGMARLASANWKLVIVNAAMVDVQGPAFQTMKELTQAAPEPGRSRVRVLFLVPELLAPEAKPLLEKEQLPYVVKPFHLHDFLERVSDLLIEAGAIAEPIRKVRAAPGGAERRKQKERRGWFDRRSSAMFASRKEYQMSEEEIAEYEKQEEEERKKKAPKHGEGGSER